MDKPAQRVKLPFWSTVWASYSWGIGRIGTVIAHRWLVLLALGAIMTAIYIVLPPYDLSAKIPQLAPSWVSICVASIASVLFTSMIAVPWHRLVLNGEPMSGTGLNFHPRVLAYTLWAALLAAVVMAPMSFIAAGAPADPLAKPTSEQLTAIFAGTGLALVMVYITTRLQLKLVAAALSDPNGTFGAIWHSTRWSFWRLFIGLLLMILPLMLVQYVLNLIAPPLNNSPVTVAVSHALQSMFSVLLTLPLLTFLSLSYQHFMGQPGGKPAGSATT
jgi:hypothetical protein